MVAREKIVTGLQLGDQHGPRDVLDLLTTQGLTGYAHLIFQDLGYDDFYGVGSSVRRPIRSPLAI